MSKLNGVVDHTTGRKTDYLYRLSLKALIVNENDKVLVVKESGRDWWDLPGGGMDHDETIEQALARELAEEVNLSGKFEYRVINVDEPVYLPNANVWQVRMIFHVTPEHMSFSEGVDADAVAFMEPADFESSDRDAERRIFRYFKSASVA